MTNLRKVKNDATKLNFNTVNIENKYLQKSNVTILENQKGITLIALVVTIIVLLILAGVSINIALNNNGIFKKAQDAGVEMEKAALKERIETLIVNWKADEIISGVTEERFWKDLEDAGIIEDANEIGEPNSTTTENGVKKDTYTIETTDDYDVEIKVTEDEKGNINITVENIEPSSSTTPKVSITELTSTETSITVKVSTKRMEGGILTYSYREKGTTNWTEWTDTETSSTQTTKTEITITSGIVKNKTYEIKVIAQNNGESKDVTGEISTDKTAPLAATATFDKTTVDAREKVTATVTLTDAGVGIDLNKSKYVFKNSSETITDESEFKNTLSSLTASGTTATGTIELTPTKGGDWYLHILSVDKAGNKTITAITDKKVTVEGPFTYNETANNIDSYVGYYADLNGDGYITEEDDGIIFADMVYASTLSEDKRSGTWNPANAKGTYVTTGGAYTISTASSSEVKSYKVSSTEYTKGKFDTAKVIILDETDTTNTSKKDRFYVMALKDIRSEKTTNNYFYWYKEAVGKTNTSDTSTNFETGKSNTEKVMGIWKAGTAGSYGVAQTTSGTYIDMWGVIEDKVAEGWFVPSANEWAAFGAAFNITQTSGTKEYYGNFGLSNFYWSSSLCNAYNAYGIFFDVGYVNMDDLNDHFRVRLCSTF